ncbi:MAG: metallophosphoesterase [Deinococcales bacterium]
MTPRATTSRRSLRLLRRRPRIGLAMCAFLVAVAAAAAASAQTVTVVAAGDIACEAGQAPGPRACQQDATAALVARIAPDAVLAVGDLQYPEGTLQQFQEGYAKNWGRFKSITYPVPGNHAYYSGGDGYYAYWGARAGEPGKGYYSFDLGAWHILAINSNCPAVGGCGADAPEVRWIAADLKAHPSRCALAFFHHPRFSSGPHGNDERMAPIWAALQAGGVDVVLSGHDHDYERFALQDANGRLDPSHGIREFVVGTGGAPQYVVLWRRAHSQALQVGTFGVLELTLRPDAYDWAFRPIPGGTFHDSGSTTCHGPPTP